MMMENESLVLWEMGEDYCYGGGNGVWWWCWMFVGCGMSAR